MIIDRSSRRWFEEAARCQVECHQGCPWCGRSHCVYQMNRGQQLIYSCQYCDFQASFDKSSGTYAHLIGEVQTAEQNVVSYGPSANPARL